MDRKKRDHPSTFGKNHIYMTLTTRTPSPPEEVGWGHLFLGARYYLQVPLWQKLIKKSPSFPTESCSHALHLHLALTGALVYYYGTFSSKKTKPLIIRCVNSLDMIC